MNEINKKITELIEKEKFFNNITSLITEGISINLGGKIVYCNKKYAEIFGYAPDELIGKEVYILVPPEFREDLKRYIEGGKEGEYEFPGLRKDGTKIYLKVNVRKFKFEDKILRLASVREITEEKLYVEKIKESEEGYKTILSVILDGILIVDFEGTILFTNFTAADLLGFKKPEEIIGKNFFDFLKTEQDKEKFQRDLSLVYHHISGYLVEYEIKDAKGLSFPVEAIGRKIYFQNKEASLISLRDISEKKMMIENLKNLIEKNKKILSQTVMALSETLTQRDPYTSFHQKRVAKLAVEITREMGFSKDIIKGIEIAALLHDIGKIFIPSDILSKPGKLNDLEWEFIKKHPEYGYNITKNIEFPWNISEIILQHHERISGTGYPQGLKGDEILLETRILSVSDVMEAMVSHRPYREKLSIEEAISEIEKNKGILYDKDVVDVCIKLYKKGFDFEDC